MRGVEFARKLRKSSTDAELRLWRRLRAAQLQGCKFRRQHPIGPWFADFACVERRLVVEIDGGQHAGSEAYDERRTEWLRRAGWRVVRFWDNEVLNEMDAVLERIASLLLESPHPGLLPAMRGEGGDGDAPSPACGRGSGCGVVSPRCGEREEAAMRPLPPAGEGRGEGISLRGAG